MVTLLSIIFTTLLLTLIVSYVVLRATAASIPLRRLFLFFVVLTPFAAAIALFKAIFGRSQPIRYNADYGSVEDEIERERVQIFGGRVMQPSFAHHWQRSYLLALEKSALAAAKKFGPVVDPSYCATTISQR